MRSGPLGRIMRGQEPPISTSPERQRMGCPNPSRALRACRGVSTLSHPQFIAAPAVAAAAAWKTEAGRSRQRSRTVRPIVNALHCGRPRFSRLVLHHNAGRYFCRASKPSPTNSQYANATIKSSPSSRLASVNWVNRNALPLRRLLSSPHNSSTAIRWAYNAVKDAALPGKAVIKNHGSLRSAGSAFLQRMTPWSVTGFESR